MAVVNITADHAVHVPCREPIVHSTQWPHRGDLQMQAFIWGQATIVLCEVCMISVSPQVRLSELIYWAGTSATPSQETSSTQAVAPLGTGRTRKDSATFPSTKLLFPPLGGEMFKLNKSLEQRLNLSSSWQQGHSTAYSTPFLI